ncbi:MAG TPA: MarR family winged helix-turn-helix transcriptional regulator [Acidimicrobiales bacterium]|nr:MarR family winged helix-turn-helix transcriptional regulator [Acidimicrobiales bacterium]
MTRTAPRDCNPADAPQSPGLTLEAGVGFLLSRSQRLARADWDRNLTDLALSAPQLSTLRAIAEWPGVGLRELARRVGADVMNAKRIADHLERLLLVRSLSDPTHRQRRVLVITDEGRSLAQAVARRAAAWNERLREQLGDEEYRDLQRLLTRVRDVMGTAASVAQDSP